jgi:hypothetical protein
MVPEGWYTETLGLTAAYTDKKREISLSLYTLQSQQHCKQFFIHVLPIKI